MLVLAAGLVGVALLAVPDATGAFFAWGLEPAPLAAFAGGVYVGSAAVYAIGLRAPARESHGLAVAAVVLSVSVLASTLAHLEVFDFGRLQAWAWVALFAAFGVATTVLAVRGPWWRAPGPRLPRAGARGCSARWARCSAASASRCGSTRARSRCRRSAGASPARGSRCSPRSPATRRSSTAAARRGCPRSRSSRCRPARWSPPRGPTAGPGYVLALAALLIAGAAVLAVSEAPGGAARRARAARTPAPLRLPAPPTPGPTVQTRY